LKSYNRSYNNQSKRVKMNDWIKHPSVRVIDERGQQLGVFPIAEALKMARDENMDLIEITDKVIPPICKIIDYGKYLYQQEKKKKEHKTQQKGGVKAVRLGLATAKHDAQIKAKKAEEFLTKGNKIKIEMVLKGREKAHKDIARQKIDEFIAMISLETIIDQELKSSRGIIIIIRKK